MYNFGQGVKVDHAKGADYWKRAADGDHPDTMCNLANLHYEGVTLPQDIGKMLDLYERAIAMGCEGAEHNLACLLRDGDCVEQNLPRALELFQSAAAKKHLGAICGIGGMYDMGIGA
jgi:uncharacterized protein